MALVYVDVSPQAGISPLSVSAIGAWALANVNSSWVLDWGDGTTPANGSVASASGNTGTQNHTYTYAGTFVVAFVVVDRAGNSNTARTTVTVPALAFEPSNWSEIAGKPFVTVTPNGPNDGGDFGPSTPGTTTAGIQEAINSLPSSGGTVYLNPGNYFTSSIAINIPSNVRLMGSGMDVTVINDSSVQACMQNSGAQNSPATNNSRIVIQDLTVDGSAQTSGTGIRFYNVTEGVLYRVKVRNTYNNTIAIREVPTAITVGASPFSYTASGGDQMVSVVGGTVSSVVVNGVTQKYTNGMYLLKNGYTITVTYTSAPTMTSYWTNTKFRVIDCHFENTRSTSAADLAIFGGVDGLIQGNLLVGPVGTGHMISCGFLKNVRIAYNTLYAGSAMAPGSAIGIDNDSGGNVIIGNVIHSWSRVIPPALHGIRVDDGGIPNVGETVIAFNEVEGCQNEGIYVFSSTYGRTVKIIGNDCYFNGQDGIRLGSTTSISNSQYIVEANHCFNNGQNGNANLQAGIKIQSGVGNVICINNNIFDDQTTPTQLDGIRIEGGTGNIFVTGNKVTGYGTGLPIRVTGANYGTLHIEKNPGYNPVGALTNPFDNTNLKVGIGVQNTGSPASGSTYTVVGGPLYIISTGGSGVSITTKANDGTVIDNAVSTLSRRLERGWTISFTFTTAPTVSVIAI